MIRTRLLLFAASLAFVTGAAAAPHKPVHHAPRAVPHAADWTRVFAATPDGGIRMGNPDARVKLVEYFSYTCPHCAAFAGEAFPKISQTYVKTGQVSFELRSALRDRLDYVAAQTARCGGPARTFGNAEAILAAQKDWEQKAIDWDGAHQVDFQGDGAAAAMHALATNAGLEAIVAKRGISSAALDRCLADKGVQAALQQTSNDAWNVRKIAGTPGFLINGTYAENVFTWGELEPMLQAALKG